MQKTCKSSFHESPILTSACWSNDKETKPTKLKPDKPSLMTGEESEFDQEVSKQLGSVRRASIARAALKQNICARCLLCVCGVKNVSLYSAEESMLWASICKAVAGSEIQGPTESQPKDGCAMCLGMLKWADEAAPAVAARMEQLGYQRGATRGFMLGVTLTSSCMIRQGLVCAYIQKALQAESGSENSGFLPMDVKDSMIDMKEAFRNAVGGRIGR
jgi:hypothetical protein